jgi:adenylate cyclase
MGTEIERKFLVDFEQIEGLDEGTSIKQGYIETKDLTVVRVRTRDEDAFLTIKGSNKGMSRLEFEYSIPLNEAKEMLEKLCSKPIIDKTRYLLNYEGHIWEIDVFYGGNEGLIVAEVELKTENENVILPPWIIKEVTSEERYYNSSLLNNPYKNWK